MRKLIAIAALLALAAAGSARALPPEETTGADGSTSPAAPEMAGPPSGAAGDTGPYAYPAGPGRSVDWVPPDGWRYPAVAGDALLVRPLMVLSLIGGGALFVATLPISAATCTTDDWLHTLGDQVDYTFRRPLGAF